MLSLDRYSAQQTNLDVVDEKMCGGFFFFVFFFVLESLFMINDHRYSCLWLDGFRDGLNWRCFSSYRKLSPLSRPQTVSSHPAQEKTIMERDLNFVIPVLCWWFGLSGSQLCVWCVWLMVSLCWRGWCLATGGHFGITPTTIWAEWMQTLKYVQFPETTCFNPILSYFWPLGPSSVFKIQPLYL